MSYQNAEIWDLEEQLYEAVQAEDSEAIRAIIAGRPEVLDARFVDGDTTLLVACERGEQELVRFLLEKGADLEAENNYHRTPLLMALAHKHGEIALELIERGADVHHTETNGIAPLYEVFDSFEGDIRFRLADALLERGADIDVDSRCDTTILIKGSGYSSDAELVRYALSHGADLSKCGNDGLTALMEAAKHGNLVELGLLLDAGADPEQGALMPLKPGWSTTSSDQGLTALMWAAKEKQEWAVKILLARGADPNTRLEHRCAQVELANEEILGRTALHFAAEAGEPGIVEQLLQAGADPQIADQCGLTAQEMLEQNPPKTEESSIDREFSWQMSQGQEPPTPEQWAELAENHARFLAEKAPHGWWQTFSVSGLPMAVYQNSETPKEVRELQASLQFGNLSEGFPKERDWSYACMVGLWGEEVDFGGAKLRWGAFVDSYLAGSNFQGADLSRADFSRSILQRANFRDANLHQTDLEGCDLRGADFTGARIDGIKIKGAQIDGAIGLLEALGLPPTSWEPEQG